MQAHEQPDPLLDHVPGPVQAMRGQLAAARSAEPAETSIGGEHSPATSAGLESYIDRYRLMEQIGEGGFGLVFVAEQQRPVRRKVALKVMKPGVDTREVIARFEAERQALALMDHPNIAACWTRDPPTAAVRTS